MRLQITFIPEDGTGYLSKTHGWPNEPAPAELWRFAFKLLRELLRAWAYRTHGDGWRSHAALWEAPGVRVADALARADDGSDHRVG